MAEGIKIALVQLLKKKIPVEAIVWLLTVRGGVWSQYCYDILADIHRDLENISNSLAKGVKIAPRTLACGDDIWKNLQSWLLSCLGKCSIYEPFIDLFTRLDDYQLSAYFYQVSYGEVPKDLYKRALPKNKSYEGNILGLKVKRKIPVQEQCRRFVLKYAKKYAKIIFIVSMLLSSHRTIYLLGKIDGFKEGLSQGGVQQEAEIPVLADKKKTALEEFPRTAKAINEIINELTNLRSKKIDRMPSNQEIIEEIEKTLVFNNNDMAELLDYKKAISKRMLGIDWRGEIASAQEKWVEAIYLYQKSKQKLSANGYIEPGKETAKSLKCDVADSLELTPIEICWQQNERRQNTQQNVTAMTEEQKQEAKAAFLGRTYPAITQILTELQEELSYLKIDGKSIHRAIRETLGVREADYEKARRAVDKGVEALSTAIYNYQVKKQTNLPRDGIIDIPIDRGNTARRNIFNVLKKEVKEKIKANPNKYKVPGG